MKIERKFEKASKLIRELYKKEKEKTTETNILIGATLLAIDRQTQEKPIEKEWEDAGYAYLCSNCEDIVGSYSRKNDVFIWKMNFCSNCGQKLDWD